MEKFTMPNNVCAVVHDKSTFARRGLSVQNTFIDPGFCGYVTLEINYQGVNNYILIPKGTGIAQIVFHKLDKSTEKPYAGKYQSQERGPQSAR
jgi:dCTP deaminase